MSKISWVNTLYKTLRAETIIPQGSTITLQMYPKGETDQCIKQLKEQIRHQKRRRCLAMARWCSDASELAHINETGKERFFQRWLGRWFMLAEKFKEVNK